jgi:hypothetical protein
LMPFWRGTVAICWSTDYLHMKKWKQIKDGETFANG